MPTSGEAIRVLYVEDDGDFAETVVTRLEREEHRLDTGVVASAEEALDRFAVDEFHCIVSDYDLPGCDGLEFLEAVREQHPEFPFILFTGEGSEAVASDAITAGVTDYVQQGSETGQYAVLANRIVTAAEDYLARREADWQRTVIRNVGEGVYAVDDDYVFRYVNSRAPEPGTLPEDNLVGRPVSYLAEIDVLSPEDVQRIRAGVDRVTEDRAEAVRVEIEPRLPEQGRTLSLRLTAVDCQGNDGLVLGTTRDITDRKECERELREKSHFLDQLFEQVPIHLYVKDTDCRHVRASEHLVDPKELIGKTDREAYPDAFGEKTMTDDRRVIETGEPILDKEERSAHDDVWNLTSKVPWYGEDGRIKGLIGVTQRITKRKEYERELERQNERLEEFASVVSHDLRNPLNVASGQLELASAECDSEHLDAVADAHDRMETLIDGLLTLTRQGESVDETAAVDLGAVADDCWATVETGAASLAVDTDRTVRGDRERVRRLLENLIRNAVEHGGSDVTVAVGDLEDEPGFYVADDGPGIPADQRDRVFESGYSTTEGGTGLGLAIVEQIAEAHGWTVRVTDGQNGGARFEITGVEHDQ